jgi:ferredoxin
MMPFRATVATELRRRTSKIRLVRANFWSSYYASLSLPSTTGAVICTRCISSPVVALKRTIVTRTAPFSKNTLKEPTASADKENEELHNVQNSSLSEYLVNKHSIETELHDDMIKALKSVYGNKMSVKDLQAFGGPGLVALAESVRSEVNDKLKKLQGRKNKNNPMRSRRRRSRIIHIAIPHHKTFFDLKWKDGDSLLDLAHENEELLGEYMEGTCGGQMSCCTCHVYLDPATFASLPPPEEAELDMLDLAHEPRPDQSRLGCQVRLGIGNSLLSDSDDDDDDNGGKKSLTQITVTIPSGVNNVWK